MTKILSFDGSGKLDPLTVSAPDIVRWIERKNPQAIANWRDLGSDEYARAFTAAQTAGLDVIDDLYFALADTIANGGGEKDFASAVIPTLKAKGWLAGDGGQIASRVQLIYDTNLRVARGAGQWDRIQRGKAGLPYLRGVTAHDDRVRHPPKSPHSDHRAFDGIVLPVDHPFWKRWWVPLGFRCRCSIIAMTRSQLARGNYFITTDADLEAREKRLGTPIFTAPGAGVAQQVSQMAQLENDRPDRMPGLPTISVPEERRQAASAWSSQVGTVALAALIDGILGNQ